MKNQSRVGLQLSVFCLALLMMAMPVLARTVAPTEPLEKRVKEAELIFTGKVIDKEVKGDWARAELLVETPLRGVKKGEKIEVIWRIQVGGEPIYDAAEGQQGVALLGDKHEGRYWLRSDKFEGLDQLEKVKTILKKAE